MRRVLKWIGIGSGVLVVLVLVVVLILNIVGGNRLSQAQTFEVSAVPIPTDETTIERGRHLVEDVSACGGCHGANLGGMEFFNGPPFGLLYAPNLTGGAGGAAATFSDEDWVRVFRHGVAPDGRPLVIMPSQNYTHLTDEDLGAIVAYLKSVPPVDNETPEPEPDLMGKVIFGILGFNTMAVNVIDHDAPPVGIPGEGMTFVQFGEYLSYLAACRDCHGENLAGGTLPGEDVVTPNLTPGGELGGWTEADFINVFRTGQTPTGRQLSEAMPWQEYNMTDEELQALWAYLQNLPAVIGESEQ